MSSLGLQVTLQYALQFPYGRHLDVSSFHGEKGLGLNHLLRSNKVASVSILRTRTRNHGFSKFNVIDLEINK
jgi:hypothetical protein